MPYQINFFNGQPGPIVQDGTLDSSYDIKFVGKNYAGYGEVQNENFLWLLESFASAQPPAKAISGQVWYDSGNKKLKFYDGTKFRTTGGAEVSATPPTGLTTGDFWFDTNTSQLKAWNGTDFTLVGPQGTPTGGRTQLSSELVKQASSTSLWPVIKAYSGDQVVAIISNQEFVPDSEYAIPGFSIIKKGLTLANAGTGDNAGVTTPSNTFFWGTAADSRKLGGLDASEYVLKDQAAFATGITFGDAGFELGNDQDIKLYIDGANGPILENQLGTTLTFRIAQSGTEYNVMKINSDAAYPGSSGVFDLGTSTLKWDNVYAVRVYSDVTGNVTGNVTGDLKGSINAADNTIAYNSVTKTFFGALGTQENPATGWVNNLKGTFDGTAANATKLGTKDISVQVPSTTDKSSALLRDIDGKVYATEFIGIARDAKNVLIDTDGYYAATKAVPVGVDKRSVPARDSSGDIFANVFQGVASSARYADLAEKYLADQDYEPGTVMVIGGEKEVTASSWGQRAIGVVSTNPAYMMNSELEGGTYVALKGRVPVKVIGAIKKGDRLIAGNNGCAVAAVPHANDVFAIALETNEITESKIVEAVIL